jgi:hypothetical protein
MDNKRQRKLGLLLLGASAIVLAISVPPMISRIRAHSAAAPTPLWQGETFGQAEFDHKGKAFTLTTEEFPDGDTHPGAIAVARWGEEETRLFSQGLDDPRLPGLDRHRHWLQIIAFPRTDNLASPEESFTGAIESESKTDGWDIVVVTRRPTTVRDPDEWKAVRSKDWKEWTYTFLELTDSGIVRSDRIYNEMDETGWRYFAASIVTPGVFKDSSRTLSVINYPNYKGVYGVIDQMGWTWSTVGVAAMTFVIGGLMIILSFGSKKHVDRVLASRERTPASDSLGTA